MDEAKQRLTAAVLVIGDEILSGRTQDVNIAAIAKFLAPSASIFAKRAASPTSRPRSSPP